MVGVAVNVTGVPMQILFAEAAIVIEGLPCAVTFMVMLLLVQLAGAAQALLVITQVTASPLANVLLLKVALFVPAGLLLTIHW